MRHSGNTSRGTGREEGAVGLFSLAVMVTGTLRASCTGLGVAVTKLPVAVVATAPWFTSEM